MRKSAWGAVLIVLGAAALWHFQKPREQIAILPEAAPFDLAKCIRVGDCRTFAPYAINHLARAERNKNRPTPPSVDVKRDAAAGDPAAATQYGRWRLEIENAQAAERYLETGAAAGHQDAHTALADLKLARSAGQDRIEAWAHLHTVQRDDGTVDQALFDRIDTLLTEEERALASDLAWRFRDEMRRARNSIDR